MTKPKKRGAGRPPIYQGERRPITVHWPADVIKYIDSVTDNRTAWLIEAAEEKMRREQAKQ